MATAAGAQTGAPLSAIEWLSDSVAMPAALPAPPQRPRTSEPPATRSAPPEPIAVTRLDDVATTMPGLYPAAARDLPADLWTGADIPALQDRLRGLKAPRLAATQELLHAILSAQTDPLAADADGNRALFLARVDGLLAVGAVGPARSLLNMAGREEPHLFRRWFDIALLTGQENAGCAAMRRLPQISPTYPARIFCLARGGDWPAAALTLESAVALDVLGPGEAERLRLFLDDLADAPRLPPPDPPTPLDFAIAAAVGTPLNTAPLPLAFSHADLRPIVGWKARIDAAERLARAGAIPPRRLWSIYGERTAAASGAVWDRVDAVQRLDQAMAQDDPDAVATALPTAWEAMRMAGLGPALARRHGAALVKMSLTGAADDIAVALGALAGIDDDLALPDFARAVRSGADVTTAAQGDLEIAIAAGLTDADTPAASADLIADGRIAEALLDAIDLIDAGAEGNLDALVDGLATLRRAGQHDRARQVALELAILGGGP